MSRAEESLVKLQDETIGIVCVCVLRVQMVVLILQRIHWAWQAQPGHKSAALLGLCESGGPPAALEVPQSKRRRAKNSQRVKPGRVESLSSASQAPEILSARLPASYSQQKA